MASPFTTQSKDTDTQTSNDTLVYMLLAHETDRTRSGRVGACASASAMIVDEP